jgi:hypothetical protein
VVCGLGYDATVCLECGDDIFFQNIFNHLQDFMKPQPTRLQLVFSAVKTSSLIKFVFLSLRYTMSKLPFTKEHLAELSGFIDLCKKDPKILQGPELAFFKSYIESLGGKIPATLSETDFESPKTSTPEPTKEKEPEPEVESEESDIELDNSGIIGRYIYLFC